MIAFHSIAVGVFMHVIMRFTVTQATDVNTTSTLNLRVTPLAEVPQVAGSNKGASFSLNLETAAKKLGLYFKQDLARKELGYAKIQDVFDRLSYKEFHPNYEEQVANISKRLEKKFEQYHEKLHTNKQTVESLYMRHLKTPLTAVQDCCKLSQAKLRFDVVYNWKISTECTCDIIPPVSSHNSFNPGRNLTDAFHHLTSLPGVKWQHFISRDQIQTVFPAHNFGDISSQHCEDNFQNSSYRSVYLSTVYPQRKNIVIMIDCGKAMDEEKLRIVKEAALYIVDSLSQNDRVNVLCIADIPVHPRGSSCVANQLCSLSYDFKNLLKGFIKDLRIHATAADHTAGFNESFHLIRNTLVRGDEPCTNEKALIIFFSQGIALRQRETFLTIAKHNALLCHQVVISTYTIKTRQSDYFWYENSFMVELAKQNFSKHQVYSSYPSNSPEGVAVTVTSIHQVPHMLSNFSGVLPYRPSSAARLGLPMQDFTKQGLVVPFFKTCLSGNSRGSVPDQVIGVVGLDIQLADIAEQITYFTSTQKNVYAFLMTPEGYTLMHPAMKRPSSQNKPVFTDISLLENMPHFSDVRLKMLLKSSGTEELCASGCDSNSLQGPRYRYTWKHVRLNAQNETIYIVAIRSSRQFASYEITNTKGHTGPSAHSVVYHRIDIVPPQTPNSVCRLGKQVATDSLASLYLSPAAFLEPFKQLSQTEEKSEIAALLAHLQDNTELTSYKLQPHVKNDVRAIKSLVNLWLNQTKTSPLRDYIIRRFVATESGALLSYPGMHMSSQFSPQRTTWYRQALANPYKVSVTAPYLDEGGLGYIVTLSVAIFNGRASNADFSTSKPIAVVGMDVTLGFMYRLLVQEMGGVCELPGMRCFLMDMQGYLLAHLSLIDGHQNGPVEGMHITHKERVVAYDILNHHPFVVKNVCNSYMDRTIQRFYKFDDTYHGVVSNVPHGEHCSKYQLTVIPGTNMFVGIVNQTCDAARDLAFCPCSRIDRSCLICGRVEQTECECPCECPLHIDPCLNGNFTAVLPMNSTCPAAPEVQSMLPPSQDVSHLKPCFDYNCEHRKQKGDCVGVITCEWCSLENDGMTPLDKPFCGKQEQCFGGVLGAESPYSAHTTLIISYKESVPVPTILTVPSTPVGPVTGGIIACILMLVMVVYCLRQRYLRSRRRHCYPEQLADAPLGSNLIEDMGRENTGSGCNNIVLATFDCPSVSPYAVNPGYHHPPNNHVNQSESDLGYSTMTPHEDSELSSSCIEPQAAQKQDAAAGSNLSANQTLPPRLLPPPSAASLGRRPRNMSSANTADLLSLDSVIHEVEASDVSCIIPHKTHHIVSHKPSQPTVTNDPGVEEGTTVLPDKPYCLVVPIQVHAVQQE